MKRKKRGAVMNVSLAGDADTVYRVRGQILQSLPVSLVSIFHLIGHPNILLTRREAMWHISY